MLKIAFDKSYKHPLGKNHRFPMIKYELIPEQLKWLLASILRPSALVDGLRLKRARL